MSVMRGISGFAVALAELHRQLLHGNNSSGTCAAARHAGLTLAVRAGGRRVRVRLEGTQEGRDPIMGAERMTEDDMARIVERMERAGASRRRESVSNGSRSECLSSRPAPGNACELGRGSVRR